MTIYHSSNCIVKKPDTKHSRKDLDFGIGFYVTTIKEQAEKYAERFKKRDETAYINVYELNNDFTSWRVKLFNEYNEEWLDFVMNCRRGHTQNDYDLVIGGVANDKVFDTVDLYTEELISKEQALQRLIYQKPNIQYCFCNDRIINQNISFIEAIII